MGYVETLFGHQDYVLSLDSLRGDNCVSVGGRDKTARYWKIVEETQLVFRGGGRSRIREILEGGLRADDIDVDHEENAKVRPKNKERVQDPDGFVEGSLDCIAMIDEVTFVTGGDSGYAACLSPEMGH
jgi:ribosomal RNA-processing protein 9